MQCAVANKTVLQIIL